MAHIFAMHSTVTALSDVCHLKEKGQNAESVSDCDSLGECDSRIG